MHMEARPAHVLVEIGEIWWRSKKQYLHL